MQHAGALGVLFAKWMSQQGARNFVLLSRSGKVQDDALAMFEEVSSVASVRKCDIGSAKDLSAMLKDVAKTMPVVRGIIHAAGILDDHLIADLERSHFEGVLAPKVNGTLNLHDGTKGLKMDYFTLFSSLASLIGTAGQANYCAANAFLDAFASYRRANGSPAVAVQWGPWAEVGMAARAGTSESMVLRIDLNDGLRAMQTILSCSAGLVTGAVGVARIKWSSFLANMPALPPFLENFKQYKKGGSKKSAVALGAAPSKDLVRAGIENILKEVLGDDSLSDFSSPLMDMGLDSLAAVARSTLHALSRSLASLLRGGGAWRGGQACRECSRDIGPMKFSSSVRATLIAPSKSHRQVAQGGRGCPYRM